MTSKIPDFSEPIANSDGTASRNWFNYWKGLTAGSRAGSFTLTVATATITLSPPLPASDYNVFFDHPTGAATWATSKGTTTFIANAAAPAGSLTFIGWTAIRR